MGNVFKLLRNWLNQSDGNVKEIITIHGQFPATDQPVYSWDNKPNIESSQFRVNHLADQYFHRTLVEYGQQLTIENCTQSLITVTGYSDSVFIDDCTECKIILGPVKGSVFLRNCNRCTVVTVCGQFRTRDCSDVDCYLLCPSQPSIETSVLFRFQCISIDYPGFHDHLARVGLNPTTFNRWSEVFDFSSTSQSNNWTLMSVEDRLEDHLTEQELIHCANHQMAFDRTTSAVLFTHPALKQSFRNSLLASVGWDISDRFYNLVETESDH